MTEEKRYDRTKIPLSGLPRRYHPTRGMFSLRPLEQIHTPTKAHAHNPPKGILLPHIKVSVYRLVVDSLACALGLAFIVQDTAAVLDFIASKLVSRSREKQQENVCMHTDNIPIQATIPLASPIANLSVAIPPMSW